MKMKFEKLLNNQLVERNPKKDQRVKPMIEQVQVQIHQCGRLLQWQGQVDNRANNNSQGNHQQAYNRAKRHQVHPDSQWHRHLIRPDREECLVSQMDIQQGHTDNPVWLGCIVMEIQIR